MSTMDTFRPDSRFSTYSFQPVARHKGLTLLGMVEWIEHRLERRRSRIALLELNDAQLKDIGLSRSQAHQEAYRPIWD